MTNLTDSIRRVERYRDDIVTHGDTAQAMTDVIEAASTSDNTGGREAACGCKIGGLHRYECAGVGHVHPPRTAERCPECRHAPHDGQAFCPNWASDNDCDCKHGRPAPAESDTGGREGDPTAAERIAEHLHERFAADHEPHWNELDESEQADSIYADMAQSLFEPGAPLALAEPDAGDQRRRMIGRDGEHDETAECGPFGCHPAESDAGDVRCSCAHDGSAHRCPHHTQEDFDAADRAREGREPDAGVCANPDCDHDRTIPSPGCARRPEPDAGVAEAKALREAFPLSRAEAIDLHWLIAVAIDTGIPRASMLNLAHRLSQRLADYTGDTSTTDAWRARTARLEADR